MRTLISIVLILTSALVGYFNVRPLYDEVKQGSAKRNSIDSALSKTKEITEAIVELGRNLDSVNPDHLKQLSSLLPARVDEIRFLNMLTFMASKHGLNLRDLTIKKKRGVEFDVESAVPGVLSVNISFATSATYVSFKKFLKDMERSLVLIDVSSIKLSTPDFQESKLVTLYNYEVVLSTYMTE